ncbi:MAG: DUF3536 domain-containing protein [Deltaproteobacteria bacterium]|jgi:alpha-amylase/alpha-mannosidase (GH57 family)|nr:DUF3536 domain-containing protein [Deltaproteobacteria bacterium]
MSTTSKTSDSATYLVVHGHFYQPPRDNPWIEAIEREQSASPYHNWNERIADECYRPNGRSRIFNDGGLVTDIVNNYCYLSYNFGPTLLSWMQERQPDIYRQVLAADKHSVVARGHGNAIAQGYSHAILPLCNARDLRTQIRWGVRDFVYRFERDPEALWLPETAINAAVVQALIEAGLRFVILAPGQARRVRPLSVREAKSKGGWVDVSGARIDPRSPYRLFSKTSPDKYIDAFFYDGPVSHAISFERLLRSSGDFVNRLTGAIDKSRSEPQLIHAAVDGETFGHHQRHANRALAYALTTIAPERGFRVTNYGAFLERFPPTHEVELEPGPNGEGTAWSCAHGVGRWYRDCSCHAGAPAGWSQAWRTPLRQAVNYVRDEAAILFEDLGGDLLEDVWTARDDYVDLLLDQSAEARQRFLQQHGRGRALGRQVRVFQLLELQRHSMQAQTSCGWFFNDISGLEAVQVMRYAARAVQLIEELSGNVVEDRLLEILSTARSNIPAQGSGADVYRAKVRGAAVDARRLVAQHAITDLHTHHHDEYQRWGYRLRQLYRRELNSGPLTVNIGRVGVEFARTGEPSDLVYALIYFGSHDFHCAVRPFAGQQSFRAFTEEIERIFESATITELLRALDAHFGESYFGLKDLLAEEREQVLEALFGHLHESFGQVYAQLYEMHRRTIGALLESGLKMPEEFMLAAAYTLTRQLLKEIRNQGGSLDSDRYERARDLVNEARKRGYELDKRPSEQLVGRQLDALVSRLVEDLDLGFIREALRLLTIAEDLELELPLSRAQDLVFDALSIRQENHFNDQQSALLGELLDRLHMSSEVMSD